MTRYRNFASGVASAYGLLVANIVFTLASVPLALHYLSKEEFGLWAYITQILGILQLIEMGVSGAFSRVIIDQKDEKGGMAYARISGAAWIILAVQGTLILVAGVIVGRWFGQHLGISPSLLQEFATVLTIQCVIVTCAYSIRVYSLLLFAHHRIAYSNLCQIGALAVMLALQWVFFALGKGIYALTIAFGAGMLVAAVTAYLGCRRWELLPKKWIRPTWNEFRLVLKFGHSIFLIHIAGQFIWAGQVLILTKALGLEAAAIWTVCTRSFLLVCQFSWRPIDLAFTFFSEMCARDELRHLWKRYSEVAGITIMTAVIAGVGFAFCNAAFVAIWTRGEISWEPLNDFLLAAWLVPLTITRCGNILIQATKELQWLKYVFIAEALVYLVAGYAAVRIDGIAAMIVVFIVASTCLTGAYTFWRVCGFFAVPVGESIKVLLLPAVPVGVSATVFAGAATWLSRGLGTDGRLVLVATAVMTGSVFALRFALGRELKAAILQRIPPRLARIAGLAIGARPAGV